MQMREEQTRSPGLRAAGCRDVVKIYRTKASVVFALDGVDLDVPTGRVVAIFGPSGSGKSSLARRLAALDVPDEGTVEVAGSRPLFSAIAAAGS